MVCISCNVHHPTKQDVLEGQKVEQKIQAHKFREKIIKEVYVM